MSHSDADVCDVAYAEYVPCLKVFKSCHTKLLVLNLSIPSLGNVNLLVYSFEALLYMKSTFFTLFVGSYDGL